MNEVYLGWRTTIPNIPTSPHLLTGSLFGMEDNHSQLWPRLLERRKKSIWDGGQPFPTAARGRACQAEVYLGWRTTIPNLRPDRP